MLGFFALRLLHAVWSPARRARLAAHGATLVSVPQQGGPAKPRGDGSWGWPAWERAMELLVLELKGARGSHAHARPLLCHSNARGPLLITALCTLMPLLYFQPLLAD